MKEVNLPLVSVIIPTYNRIHTLPVSINSVLNQTYKNIEVIIMDDGSEDGTEQFVKNIADNRVRYKRSSANMGPSAARNMGVEIARGEYIAFQDSDDEWLPDKLAKQMELMLRDKELSLVYCELEMFEEGEFLLQIPSRDIPYEQKYGDLFSYLLLCPLISTQTIVVKKAAFLSEKGFDETLKSNEDYEFTLRFSQKHKIGFVEEPLVKVNSSPDSVSKRFTERIHSQFYMVRKMLGPLRERELLWTKMGIILYEAESCLCYDTFIEEPTQLSRELLSGKERQIAQAFLEKAEYSKGISLLKTDVLNSLLGLKKVIIKIYAELYEDKSIWSERQRQELERLADVVQDCEKLSEIPANIKEQYNLISQKQKDSSLQWKDQLFLLADVVELLESLEGYIVEQI